MALIRCPECNREISDQAAACPGCGYPLVRKATDEVEEKLSRKGFPPKQIEGYELDLPVVFDMEEAETGENGRISERKTHDRTFYR